MLLTAFSVFATGAGIEWEILNQEAEDLFDAGEYNRAVIVARKAFEVAEKNVGPNHSSVATSLNNLGLLYKNQGQYDEAEPLLKRALAIREKVYGPDHPGVATNLNNLGTRYHSQGQYALAEPLLKRALAIYEKALGKDHPEVAISLNNLALLYRALAEKLEKRAARIISFHEKQK